jgi:hypothetical protein
MVPSLSLGSLSCDANMIRLWIDEYSSNGFDGEKFLRVSYRTELLWGRSLGSLSGG